MMSVSGGARPVAVMLSGRGSNFAAVLAAMDRGEIAGHVALVIASREDAGGLEIARERGIPTEVIRKKDFPDADAFDRANLAALKGGGAVLVVLAGYLSTVGPRTVAAYPNAIINVHPALLPAFGGSGCYGHHVHEAVLAAGCKVSGATVHFVTAELDAGPIIAQGAVPVLDDDDPASLAARVLAQEHRLLPMAVAAALGGELRLEGNRVLGFPCHGISR